MTARYDGICGTCGESFKAGTTIKRVTRTARRGGSWGHTTCAATLKSAYGSDFEAACGVGSIDFDVADEPCCEGLGERGIDPKCGFNYDDPSHPENAEHALALEETGQHVELAHWAGHFA